jgi:hypothetical protein
MQRHGNGLTRDDLRRREAMMNVTVVIFYEGVDC